MPPDPAGSWNALNDWAYAIIADAPQFTSLGEIDAHMARLSSQARGLAGLKWVEAEVNNGGFFQLYTNGGGCWAPEAPAGFAMIGRSDVGIIVDRSLALFPDRETALVRSKAEDFLDHAGVSICREFEALDQAFYACDDYAPQLQRFADLHVVGGKVTWPSSSTGG